jgi:cytochrome c2
MKMIRLFICMAFLAILGSAPQSAFGKDKALSSFLPGNPLEGSKIFTSKGCLRCHAVHGVGGATGPDLGQGILNRPLLEIAGVMWNHSPGMAHVFQKQRAVRPRFTAEEMASLLAFLYYLGSLDSPGDPEIGGRLFIDKGCQNCHSLGGKGGSAGPTLDNYSRYASPLFLTTALWNRGKAMAEAMEVLNLPRATFQGNDIPDLMAYLRSVGGGIERIYVPPGNPRSGQKLFATMACAKCHPVTDGSKGIGPDLRVKLKGSLMQISGAMWNHGPKMWGRMVQMRIDVPTLVTEEMSDLISYLYFLQFIDPPGDAKRGRIVYQQKRCAACHAFPEVGMTAGPDLAKIKKLETPIEVITAMWNHAGGMEEMMLKQSVAWPILKGGETADLIAYLLSIRKGPGS